mgnify:CR=1 FL=1
MAAPRNLVNLNGVAKGFASRTILHDVTLGVAAGDRIGVVGRNGDGKSTLLRLVAGLEEPDEGLVTRTGGVHLELLGQRPLHEPVALAELDLPPQVGHPRQRRDLPRQDRRAEPQRPRQRLQPASRSPPRPSR